MLLDAGNSRFKWASLQSGMLCPTAYGEYKSADRAQTVAAALGSAGISRIVVASVLGDEFSEQFTRAVSGALGVQPEFVVPRQGGHGIRIAYANPAALGPDRYAALVAARWTHQQPCVIVDCGTAVTIDALADDGEHLGGLILPGLDLMRRSLSEHTARIGFYDSNNDTPLFGRSTPQAVASGTVRALVGAIDRIVKDMSLFLVEQHDGRAVRLLMTGGGGPSLLPDLATDYHLEPHLVLQGLALIAESSP